MKCNQSIPVTSALDFQFLSKFPKRCDKYRPVSQVDEKMLRTRLKYHDVEPLKAHSAGRTGMLT
jgi:hypothetical protein